MAAMRVGHVFASRYKAILIDQEFYLLELSRYIHLNPVRANIVDKPEKFKWSSYQEFLGQRKTDWLNSEWLLKIFGADINTARQKYQEFVEKGIQAKSKDPFKEIVAGMILGKKTYVDYVKSKITPEQWRSDQFSEIRKLKEYPTLEEIAQVVNAQTGLYHKEKRNRATWLNPT